MALRRATRTYESIPEFLEEYNSTLAQGGIFLPPGTTRRELANEVRLDLVLPIVGRVGPLTAQVVHRAPDGGVGLRLPHVADEAREAFSRFMDTIAEIRTYLIETGDLLPREDITELETELAQTRADLESAQARIEDLESAGPPASGGAPARRVGRGFPVPDLSGVESALSGDLSDRSMRDAIIHLAVERTTGLLTINGADGTTRYGFWSKGGPVGWRSEPLQEAEVRGVLLFKAKQINRDQLAESLSTMEERGCRQGEALIDMGVLSFPQLIMVLGSQVEYVLQRAMRVREGTWTFHTLADLPEQFLPPALRVPSLLFRALSKRARELRSSDLADSHRGNLDRSVYLADDVGQVIEEIKLQPLEAKLLDVLRSNAWRLRELFSVSPLSKHQTAAMLWAFNELGFLRYESGEDTERAMRRVAHRIERKKKQLTRATHFDVLEVHWISLPREIEANYQRLIGEFDAAGFGVTLPEALELQRAQVADRIEQAHAVLSKESSRREYRKSKVEAFMIVQSADLLAKKGEMAIMRQDRREACSCYAKALELVPNRAEFADGLRRATAIV